MGAFKRKEYMTHTVNKNETTHFITYFSGRSILDILPVVTEFIKNRGTKYFDHIDHVDFSSEVGPWHVVGVYYSLETEE